MQWKAAERLIWYAGHPKAVSRGRKGSDACSCFASDPSATRDSLHSFKLFFGFCCCCCLGVWLYFIHLFICRFLSLFLIFVYFFPMVYYHPYLSLFFFFVCFTLYGLYQFSPLCSLWYSFIYLCSTCFALFFPLGFFRTRAFLIQNVSSLLILHLLCVFLS